MRAKHSSSLLNETIKKFFFVSRQDGDAAASQQVAAAPAEAGSAASLSVSRAVGLLPEAAAVMSATAQPALKQQPVSHVGVEQLQQLLQEQDSFAAGLDPQQQQQQHTSTINQHVAADTVPPLPQQQQKQNDTDEAALSSAPGTAAGTNGAASVLQDDEAYFSQLLATLSGGSPEQCAVAAEALFNYTAESDSARQRAAAAGVVPHLVELLRVSTEHGKMYAAYTLSSLTTIDEALESMRAASAIPALLDILAVCPLLVCKKGAMRALGRLARSDAAAHDIVQAGGLATIIALLSRPDSSLVRRCLIALYFIGADKDPLQAAIGAAGALPQLLQLAASESADVQAEATDVLKVLCRNAACGRTLLELQGEDVLANVVQAGLTSRARASAARALQRLHCIPELSEALAASAANELVQVAAESTSSLPPGASGVLSTCPAAPPVTAMRAPSLAEPAVAALHQGRQQQQQQQQQQEEAVADGLQELAHGDSSALPACSEEGVAASAGAGAALDMDDIQQLAQVLSCGNSRWLREKAATAVEQLAAENLAACRDLADLGALSSLLEMVGAANSGSTRRAAARALGALGDDATLLMHMSSGPGVLPKLLEAAPQLAGSAQRALIKVLHALAGVQQTAPAFPHQEAVRSMMRVLEGVVGGASSNANGHDAAARNSMLSSGSSSGSGGGVGTSADAATTARVLDVLLALCRRDAAALSGITAHQGGLRLLVSKLQHGPRSSAGIVLQLLALLAEHKQHQEQLLKCGVVPTLLLLYRAEDATLAAQAARILEALSEPASHILQRTLSGSPRLAEASSSGSSACSSPTVVASVVAGGDAEKGCWPAAAGSGPNTALPLRGLSGPAVTQQQQQRDATAAAAPVPDRPSGLPVSPRARRVSSSASSPHLRVAPAVAALEAAAAQAAQACNRPPSIAAPARAPPLRQAPTASRVGNKSSSSSPGPVQPTHAGGADEQPLGRINGSSSSSANGSRSSPRQPEGFQQQFVSKLPRHELPLPRQQAAASLEGNSNRLAGSEASKAAASVARSTALASAGTRASPRPSSSPASAASSGAPAAASAAPGAAPSASRPSGSASASLRQLAQQRRTQHNLAVAAAVSDATCPPAAATPTAAQLRQQSTQQQPAEPPAAPKVDGVAAARHSGRVVQLSAALGGRAQSPPAPRAPTPRKQADAGASSEGSSSGGGARPARQQRQQAGVGASEQHPSELPVQQQMPAALQGPAPAQPSGGAVRDAPAARPAIAAAEAAATEADDLLSSTYDNLQGLLMKKGDIEICRTPEGRKCRLGEGGFGIVYKAVMNGVDEVAVKLVKAETPSRKELELFLKEVQTLAKLHHRNIVQFYGACLEMGSMFFVTELMKGGDLYSALRHHAETMQWDRLGRKVALDVALGLNYLHAQRPPMMHRDLKSPNVLLSEEGVAKIADVGMVRSQVQELVTAQPVMTPLWAAPEVVRHERASIKADIWSYGILIWELVTGEDITEFQPLSISRQVGPSPNAKAMSLPARCPPVARKLFVACTQMDPERRPSAQQLVEWLRADIAGSR